MKQTTSYLVAILILVVVITMFLPKCATDRNFNNELQLQMKIDSLNAAIDSVKVKVVVIDSTRIKTVYKYRTLRDTFNIHDTTQVLRLVNICDSIITIDSTEIAELKVINNTYNYLVNLKDTVIKNKEIELRLQNKKHKKHLLQVGAIGVLSGLIVGLIIK